MKFVCNSEDPQIVRYLHSSTKIKEILLALKHGKSVSLADVCMQGLDKATVRRAISSDLLFVEKDYWLERCATKGDCLFLYLSSNLKLTELGEEVSDRISNNCYCILSKK